MNYVTFPGMTEQDKIDPTFMDFCIHRSFTTFGVEIGNKNKAAAGGSANISRKIWRCLLRKQLRQHPHRQ